MNVVFFFILPLYQPGEAMSKPSVQGKPNLAHCVFYNRFNKEKMYDLQAEGHEKHSVK